MNKKLIVTLLSLLTLAACSGSDQHSHSTQEGASFSNRSPLRQSKMDYPTPDRISEFEAIGKIQSDLTKFVQRSYGVTYCIPWILRRVSIANSIQLIRTIMPKSKQRERITQFVSDNASKIIVLLAETQVGDHEYAMLKLNYQSGLNVPQGLGCSSGLLFDLSSLQKDPDDPDNSPCYFSMGNTGPCCSCVQGYTGQRGCNQSLTCPSGDCCHSDSTEQCLYDQIAKPLESIEYGELLHSSATLTPVESVPSFQH